MIFGGKKPDLPDGRIPDSLAARLALFEEEGIFIEQPHDLFREGSWAAVLIGQGMLPKRYHPAADAAPREALESPLARLRAAAEARLGELPEHELYLARCLDRAAA